MCDPEITSVLTLGVEGEVVEIRNKYISCFVGWTRKPKSPAKAGSTKPEMTKTSRGRHKGKEDSTPPEKESHKDNSFRQFRRLCATLSETESYNEKTAIVRKFFTKGTNGCEYRCLNICSSRQSVKS